MLTGIGLACKMSKARVFLSVLLCFFLLNTSTAGKSLAGDGGLIADDLEVTMNKIRNGNVEEAIENLSDEAGLGSAQAASLLGRYYYHGIFVEKNVEVATPLLWQAANAGDASAMTLLFFDGYQESTDASEKLALMEMLKRAADANLPEAHYLLGASYAFGDGVERSRPKAISHFEKALEGGYLSAKEWLGNFDDLQALSDKRYIEKYHESIKIRTERHMLEGFPVSTFLYALAILTSAKNPNKTKSDSLVIVAEAFQYLQLAYFFEVLGVEEVFKNAGMNIEAPLRNTESWLRERAGKKNTFFGEASRWCVERNDSSFPCLRYAVKGYEQCRHLVDGLVEPDKGYTPGYDRCRTSIVNAR